MTTFCKTPTLRNLLPDDKDIVTLVNGTFDDLRDWNDKDGRAAKKAHKGPLLERYDSVLPGEGALETVAEGELMFQSIVKMEGTLFVVMELVFHYRNDSTRHMWSGPNPTLEPHIPFPEVVTPLAEAAYHKAVANGCRAALRYNEYEQPNGTSTDDRHLLELYFPIDDLKTPVDVVSKSIAAVS